MTPPEVYFWQCGGGLEPPLRPCWEIKCAENIIEHITELIKYDKS